MKCLMCRWLTEETRADARLEETKETRPGLKVRVVTDLKDILQKF